MTLIPRKLIWISYAAWGCVAGGLLHIACIIGGPDWFDFLGAPPEFGEALRRGEWVEAVLITLGIAAFLFIWAAYAFSAREGRKPLPFAKFVCAAVAFIFLLRGALGIPFLLYVMMRGGPAVFTLFHLGASIFVFTLGLGFARAFLRVKDLIPE
jgi:hypothetical protein